VRKRFAFLVILLLAGGEAFAQDPSSVEGKTNKVPVLFDTMTVMPYLTVSMNLFSGQAFLADASGPGFGAGITFDLTKEGQKTGFMFDFAFQEMYGVAQNGSFISPLVTGDTGVNPSANAYHYWQYLLFEPFLKLQTSSKRTGYFMIGASCGFAVESETVSIAPGYPYEFQNWDQTSFGHRFRLDLRAGVGVELAKIGSHSLMLEARAGYPLTNEISNYGGSTGSLRIITIQGNFGVRL
jgi:hypothetical protein